MFSKSYCSIVDDILVGENLLFAVDEPSQARELPPILGRNDYYYNIKD